MTQTGPQGMRSAVLVFEAGQDPSLALRWLRSLAPDLHRLHLLVWASVQSGWWADARWVQAADRLAEGEAVLTELQTRLSGWAQVDGNIVVELDQLAIADAVAAHDAELVVWGPIRESASTIVGQLLMPGDPTQRRPQLLIGSSAGEPRPVRAVACPYVGAVQQLAPLPAVWSRLMPGKPRVHLLALPPQGDGSDDPIELAGLLGLGQDVHHSHVSMRLDLADAARRFMVEQAIDLVAVALPATASLAPLVLPRLATRAPDALAAPLLIVPGPDDSAPARLVATDVLRRADQPLRVRIEQVDRITGAEAWSGRLGLSSAGRQLGQVQVIDGVGVLPPLPPGVASISLVDPDIPDLVRITRVRIATADSLDLVAGDLDPDELGQVAAGLGSHPGRTIAIVRLASNRRLDLLRRQAFDAGLRSAILLDAALELDDGAETDLPTRVDTIRLVRLARHLRVDGLPVDRIALRQAAGAVAPQLQLWPVASEGAPPARALDAVSPVKELGARLNVLGSCRPHEHCQVAIELDNRVAREGWLDLVERARHRVHLQTYIVEPDAVSTRIAAALAVAARRGVEVRVLVDSLLSRHGSLGQQNPVLTRLAAAPGVALRQHRPILGLPGIDDLKLRSHRKLLVVDDSDAIVTGRNLGHQYLAGFDEVLVAPTTPSDEVPWLDAGARLQGPVVADVARAFHDSWVAAGGDGFPVALPQPGQGQASVRLVLHEGLADTHTLDAYRTLIDGARTRLWVVNTFPLQHELLGALLRARQRGVDVRALAGNVRPVHGNRLPFPNSLAARELATQVIHGRLDVLARAGVTVAEVAMRKLPGWDPDWGAVRPHVHAKLLVADGRWTAVGSANMDVTAGYWESEALAVIDDAETAVGVEAQLDALLAHGIPFDPDDPTWRVLADRRAWLSRNWPSMVG